MLLYRKGKETASISFYRKATSFQIKTAALSGGCSFSIPFGINADGEADNECGADRVRDPGGDYHRYIRGQGSAAGSCTRRHRPL